MFVDSVEIFATSGNGGAGAVSFRREKFVIQGGPDGGDGGKGGDVIVQVDTNLNTLASFRGIKHYKAKNGEAGKSRRCSGKNGENIVIKVPLGTQIFDVQNKNLLADLDTNQSSIVLLTGGKGGLGNARFKNSINQTPTYAQKGIPGQTLQIRLELKLLADVGLVGYPNVGKSSLISALSNAKPEVANYEFTTLTPHLGVVEVDDLHSFVMADIPGIIEGASEGKGLGLEFLKHIERTKFLLFVLDSTRDMTPKLQYKHLTKELYSFDAQLAHRPFGIVISKIDSAESSMVEDFIQEICAFFGITQNMLSPHSIQPPNETHQIIPNFIIDVSSVAHINTDILKFRLHNALSSKTNNSSD